MMRCAEISRKTKETDIYVRLDLDGNGKTDIDTGIGFFDHMLDAFGRHGLFDLTVKVKGDLHVDGHHTVEDTGIVLGQAIAEAVGDKKGIRRYGFFILPMDETLVLCALDLAGRAAYESDLQFITPSVGSLDTQLIREFFIAVSQNAAMNLHFHEIRGINDHHVAEAAFKSFAKALDMAVSFDDRITDVLSTKGSL